MIRKIQHVALIAGLAIFGAGCAMNVASSGAGSGKSTTAEKAEKAEPTQVAKAEPAGSSVNVSVNVSGSEKGDGKAKAKGDGHGKAKGKGKAKLRLSKKKGKGIGKAKKVKKPRYRIKGKGKGKGKARIELVVNVKGKGKAKGKIDKKKDKKKKKAKKKNKKKKGKKGKKGEAETEAEAPEEEAEPEPEPEPEEEVEDAPEPEVIPPPDTPPENDFGYEQPVAGCFEGEVMFIKPQSRMLPTDYTKYEVESLVYACEWDIETRSFSSGFPGVEDKFEWFAIRYSGAFNVQTAGEYTFRINSDDGTKLFIDGKLVVDNDGVHPPRDKSGTVNLKAGDHELVLEYFQGPRYHIALQVFVTPPGGEEGIFSVRE